MLDSAQLYRACLQEIIDENTDDETVLKNIWYHPEYRQRAQEMLDALAKLPEKAVKPALENIFGYLFAKAIETGNYERHKPGTLSRRLPPKYSSEDAIRGAIVAPLNKNGQEKLEKAMILGRQFYKDYKFFHAYCSPADEDILEALTVVQMLGYMYSFKCLG